MKQKKKHSKYRNKLHPEEKKKLSLVKDNVKQNKLKRDIYRLPFDIKCKIFQMAMIANIPLWVMELRPKFRFVKQEFFNNEKGIGYYDGNGFSYSVPHNYIRNLDTLIINFQSGDIKKFVINELTVEKLNITSIDEKKYTPIFDGNGIYRDTVLMSLTSEEYLFDLAQ